MRSGAYTVQQTLTAEAASVLKQSLSLARRRNHGQVTPLHVAATLLSSRSSLLRSACIKSQPQQTSQSYPLQCSRVLELCFNVALNRLPTTTPSPLLHGGQVSLSNALIAALKRAQAHQRRGCIEQKQEQPLLTIKVELPQLIISILDDPSVSRVMREAGFTSTAVKNNIEDSSLAGVFSDSHGTFWQTHILANSSEHNPFFFSSQKKASSNYITDSSSVEEDIELVFEVFLRKKGKNAVIVGDCVSTTECLVSELKCKIERGDVPEEMKNVHFVKFYFAPLSLRFMKKEDVEKHLTDLKRRVDYIAAEGEGVLIYTGDLKWTTAEENVNGELLAYNAVDHLVNEIARLIFGYNSSNTKVWLMATASNQTYLRCQMRQPPLEAQWALQAVSVPSRGLGLSLHASSVQDSQGLDKLTCCEECALNYEKDVQSIKSSQQKLLPPWLQSHGGNNGSLKDEILELSGKWNRLCHSLHQVRHNQNHLRSTMNINKSLSGQGYPYTSSYPLWPFQNNIDSGLKQNHSPNTVPKFRRQNSCTIEFSFGNGAEHKNQSGEVPNLDSLKNGEDKEMKITLGLGNSLFSNSGRQTKETSELCRLLEDNVPWQSKIIPSIAKALKHSKFVKKRTWLLIQGNDVIGKRRLASAVAESILGSADLLLHMNMRYDEATSCYESLVRALGNNERLVVLVENIDLADTKFLKLLADEFEAKGGIGQAIFILTKSICSSYEDDERNRDYVIEMKLNVNEKSSDFGRNSSDNKRKPEWDVSNKIKTSRIDEEDEIKKDLSRQSSHNTLDLNMKADTSIEIEFLESIQNHYVLDRNAARDKEMKGFFMSKMKGTMEATFGGENVISFSVEDKVLDEILFGSSYFLNGLFEKWLKDVFQVGLETVKIGGKYGIHEIMLSYGGINGIREKVMGNGYMGTCLPNRIQVSFAG